MELDPIGFTWLGLTSRRASAIGEEGGMLRGLQAEGLRADIRPSSLLKGYWEVERISLEKLHLHFGKTGKVDASPAPGPTPSQMPAWIPSRTVIGVVHGAKTDILIELSAGRTFLLDGATLECRPGEGESVVDLSGGTLISPFYPDLVLTMGKARWVLSKDKAELLGADLSSPKGGKIRLTGVFRNGEHPSEISGNWTGLPAEVLLPKFANKVAGSFCGEASSSWSDGHREARGVIRSDNLVLSGIPSFGKLAELSGLPGFRNLQVGRFESRFFMSDGTTRWEDILLESPGLLKCTGSAETTADGRLSGTFRFGITTQIVSMIPFSRELLGLEESEGYIWTRQPVTVGGTLSHPEENLTPRITMLMAAGATGVVRNGIREALDLLGVHPGNRAEGQGTFTPPNPDPAAEAEKAAGRILDSAAGLLR
jgi:hypothetical protein